ncbi:Iron-sulfur cluster co-chaperone protein HscB, mitochondrial Hsc20 [Triplophysa tibetana]|uniref:Iron-sulfur cluster co-chaperone protein HscB, mitochondrial Hsc20 n=1 Tax=Triplophysa tibetana TaxID=1572043 RepID=A0A5A9P4Z9_9TELE|nr:Iron-sulfur cluster co-chaperone protein HscB, mitochondrial Hsc20 [Triplophysa tibetana]
METLNRLLFLKTFQGLKHAHGLIYKGHSLAPGVSCFALQRCFTSHNQDMKVVFHKAAKANLTLNYRCLCTVTAYRVCWNCGSSTELFFCSSCKVIQPPRDDINYFQILNCEEKFSLDTKKLQKRFVELQRFLHPDNFSQKSLKEQENSETQSALVNKAYRTLQKPLSRAIYMLELRGVLLEEGTDATADPAILLEVMEVNESLAETRNQDEVNAIGQSVRDKLKDLTEQMNLSLKKGDLLTAKGLLVQMKYMSNIEEKVKQRITESW